MSKLVLVTGSSSGIGLATVIAFAKERYQVIATMRDLSKREALESRARQAGVRSLIEIVEMDVTKANDIARVTDTFKQTQRSLDILVNNAGFAMPGFVEALTTDDYREQFETNFFGVVEVTNQLLPMLREAKGTIINISSISGLIGFPGVSAYSASKHALEGYSESLRHEVRPFDVKVALVEPGSYATNIWEKADKKLTMTQLGVYEDMVIRLRDRQQGKNAHLPPPDVVVKTIIKAASESGRRLRYPVGSSTRIMKLCQRLLPWKIWERLVHKETFQGRR